MVFDGLRNEDSRDFYTRLLRATIVTYWSGQVPIFPIFWPAFYFLLFFHEILSFSYFLGTKLSNSTKN